MNPKILKWFKRTKKNWQNNESMSKVLQFIDYSECKKVLQNNDECKILMEKLEEGEIGKII
jgi:uncharacterized Fe-S center protein